MNSNSNEDSDDFGYYDLSVLPPPHRCSAGSPFVLPYRYINKTILRCVLGISVVYLLLHMIPTKTVKKPNGYAILIWNADVDTPSWDHLQCGCKVTSNRNYDKGTIDAVVVYGDRPYSLLGLERIQHTPDYLVVFAVSNPLSLAQNPLYAHGDSIFNFTMTYRLDSDLIWTSYYFSKRSQVDERLQEFELPEENFMDELPMQHQFQLRQRLKQKDFLVVYMLYEVNDYNLPESLYLQELRNYIELDAHMDCSGGMDCSHYKFMLIFDPSSCPDYVHPQFYMALENFVVPVLIGGSNLTKLAPPGSYISSLEYSSPKILAERLKKLAKDPKLYEQFFWWHSKYQLQKITQPYCRLCHQLQHKRRQRQPDMFLHWWTQYQCSNRTDRLDWSPK